MTKKYEKLPSMQRVMSTTVFEPVHEILVLTAYVHPHSLLRAYPARNVA